MVGHSADDFRLFIDQLPRHLCTVGRDCCYEPFRASGLSDGSADLLWRVRIRSKSGSGSDGDDKTDEERF